MITDENSSSNHLRAVAGVLAVVAAALYFVAPAEMTATSSERIGLQDGALGPVAEEAATGRSAAPRPGPAKGGEPHISFFHARKSRAARAGAPTGVTDSQWQPVIKATTRERGHLIERYLFRNGGIVVMVDGRVVLVS